MVSWTKSGLSGNFLAVSQLIAEVLMKSRCLLALAVATLLAGSASPLAADASKPDAVRKELAKFEGTWRFVSMNIQGMKVPEEQLKKFPKMVIHGKQFTLPEGDTTFRGTFKVDVSTKPKQIDVTFTSGPEKGKTCLGIYELEGDTYKVCMGLVGKPRPKAFVAKAGSGHVLEVLKREKAKSHREKD
jgi:uncharacterized protein (TIGR03067 family)